MVVNVYMVRRSDQSRRNGTFRHINCHMSIEFLLSSAFCTAFRRIPDPAGTSRAHTHEQYARQPGLKVVAYRSGCPAAHI